MLARRTPSSFWLSKGTTGTPRSVAACANNSSRDSIPAGAGHKREGRNKPRRLQLQKIFEFRDGHRLPRGAVVVGHDALDLLLSKPACPSGAHVALLKHSGEGLGIESLKRFILVCMLDDKGSCAI
jgi:hypothetical protein